MPDSPAMRVYHLGVAHNGLVPFASPAEISVPFVEAISMRVTGYNINSDHCHQHYCAGRAFTWGLWGFRYSGLPVRNAFDSYVKETGRRWFRCTVQVQVINIDRFVDAICVMFPGK